MKEDELREHATCSNCKKGIGHTGIPLFWTVKIDRHGLEGNALQRQQGLAMMLGGNAALARVMGLDEEMTQKMMDTVNITLCERCSMEDISVMRLVEKCREED